MLSSRATKALFVLVLTATIYRASAGPTAPMDLTTGKTDSTEVGMGGNEALQPQTPPQTVEGTLVSVDLAKSVAVVRTLRDGDVKMGLPVNTVVSHDGRDGTLQDLKPGDNIFATVVTPSGVRALRIVDDTPANPMISLIGIPVLCVIGAWIWWYRRKTAPAPPAQLKAQPRTN